MRVIHSDQWYRVVGLKPRLRLNVQVQRQVVRNEVWMLLAVGQKQRTQRLNAAAWAFIGRCDGRQTVQQVWDAMVAGEPDLLPTQDDIIALMSQLYSAQLIDFERAPHIELRLETQREGRAKERRSRLNPMAFRVKLLDPSRWLGRFDGLAQALFSGPAFWAWMALMVWAIVLVIMQGPALTDRVAQWSANPALLICAWAVYPVIKAVHEFAHALAVRRWGGQVREAGVSLFLLMPLPYVDASAANLFAHRYQRAWVSAAGIAAELACASLALTLWAITSPGLVNDLALTAAMVGGVSTLVFNANPLMRLDGYYLLSDAAGLPNLAMRSGQWWIEHLRRMLTARHTPVSLRPQSGELPWLVAYAPAAWAYRIGLSFVLSLWAGAFHAALGVIVAVACCIWMVGLPAWQALRQLFKPVPAGRIRAAFNLRIGLGLGVFFLAIAVVPAPDRFVAQGVVWLPDEAWLRAPSAGFVQAVHSPAAPHRAIGAGARLITLDDPTLRVQLEQLHAREQGLNATLYQHLLSDPAKSLQTRQALDLVRSEIEQLNARLLELAIDAPLAGKASLPFVQDMPGRYVKQGDMLGAVVPAQASVVRAVLDQAQRARLLESSGAQMQVRLAQGGSASGLGPRWSATVKNQIPAALPELPSLALATTHGGRIDLDPLDKQGRRPAHPSFAIDVALQEIAQREKLAQHIGARAWVRFDLGWTPLGVQWVRELRSTISSRFSPVES
jgi:putative peptide zinc metalloprotease protein